MARPKSGDFDQNEYINGYIKEHYQHPIMLDKEIRDIEVLRYEGTGTVEQVKFIIKECDNIEDTVIAGWH